MEIEKGEMAVFVGAGGKSSAINLLAEELSLLGLPVAITTTTKIYPPDNFRYRLVLAGDTDHLSLDNSKTELANDAPSIIVIGKEINDENKIVGLTPGQINRIREIRPELTILVEGDGAKGKTFKAPREFEPVIPDKADLVVPVMGVDSIGRGIDGTHFHAVEKVCLLTGLKAGDFFGAKDAANILLNKEGYQKGVPKGARWIPLINKIDAPGDREKAFELAGILKGSGVEKIILSSLKGRDNMVETY